MKQLLILALILATGLAPAATFRVTDLEVGGGYGEANTEIGNDGGLTIGSDGEIQTDGNVTIGGTLDTSEIQNTSGELVLNDTVDIRGSLYDSTGFLTAADHWSMGAFILLFQDGRVSINSGNAWGGFEANQDVLFTIDRDNNSTANHFTWRTDAANTTGTIIMQLTDEGALDVSSTLTAGSGNTTLTSATGELLHAAIEQNGATDGQVLSWNNTAGNWEPAAAGGGVSGTGSINQLAYWSDSSTITGSSGATYDGTRLDTSGIIQAGSGNEDITDAAGKLQQTAIEQDGASTDDVLTWNGTRWNPAPVDSSGMWSETTISNVTTTVATGGATLVILNDDTPADLEILDGGLAGQHIIILNVSTSSVDIIDESGSSEGNANIILGISSTRTLGSAEAFEVVYRSADDMYYEVD